jgi:hypothetical protein
VLCQGNQYLRAVLVQYPVDHLEDTAQFRETVSEQSNDHTLEMPLITLWRYQ